MTIDRQQNFNYLSLLYKHNSQGTQNIKNNDVEISNLVIQIGV